MELWGEGSVLGGLVRCSRLRVLRFLDVDICSAV